MKSKEYIGQDGGFQFRYAIDSDASTIGRIYNYYAVKGGYTYTDKTVNADTYYKMLVNSSIAVYVIEDDRGVVVGYGAMSQLHPATNIAVVIGFILPEYVNKGLEAWAWTHWEGIAKFFGIDSFVVNMPSTNEKSIAVQKKFGFEVVGTIKDMRVGKGEKFDQVWMQKQVDRGL